MLCSVAGATQRMSSSVKDSAGQLGLAMEFLLHHKRKRYVAVIKLTKIWVISEQVQSQRIQRAVQAKTKNHPQKIGIKLLRSARMRLRLRQKTNKLSMMVQKSCKIKKRKSRLSLPILGQLQMLRDSATKGNLSVALNIRTRSLRGLISPWSTLLRMSNT